MELSILGELLTRNSSDTTKYYGYWMPRGGDQGTFAVEVIRASNSGFQVFIQTRDSDSDDASATTLGSAQALTTAGITKWTVSGAKEWVRYVIEPTGSNTPVLQFQFLAPQWAPN
ncbi:MAG: hypothetical protein U1F36_11150 [Planctomycetota bacterium]